MHMHPFKEDLDINNLSTESSRLETLVYSVNWFICLEDLYFRQV
jgi:hypothetical protein